MEKPRISRQKVEQMEEQLRETIEENTKLEKELRIEEKKLVRCNQNRTKAKNVLGAKLKL